MSADTYDALQAAIQVHVDSESEDGPQLVTDWIITAASIGGQEGTIYTRAMSTTTAPHAHLGLALETYRQAKKDWDREEEEDDR